MHRLVASFNANAVMYTEMFCLWKNLVRITHTTRMLKISPDTMRIGGYIVFKITNGVPEAREMSERLVLWVLLMTSMVTHISSTFHSIY